MASSLCAAKKIDGQTIFVGRSIAMFANIALTIAASMPSEEGRISVVLLLIWFGILAIILKD